MQGVIEMSCEINVKLSNLAFLFTVVYRLYDIINRI